MIIDTKHTYLTLHSARLHERRWHGAVGRVAASLIVTALLVPGTAFAQTYSLPDGPLPSGCTASGSQVDCNNDVDIGEDDTVELTQAVTWSIDANLSVSENASINSSGDPADLDLDVTGNIDLSEAASVTGNVSADGDVTGGDDALFDGSVTSQGDITLGDGTTVKGDVDSDGDISTGENAVISGSIDASNNVDLGDSASAGSIDAGSDVTLGDGASSSSVNTGGNLDTGENSDIGGDAVVDGDVDLGDSTNLDGSIYSKGDVTVGDSGEVNGNIVARNGQISVGEGAVVQGCLIGNQTDVDSTAQINCEASEGCSPFIGDATINEVRRSQGGVDAFIEIKLVDSSIPASEYDQWTVSYVGAATAPGNSRNKLENKPLGQLEQSGFPWLVLPAQDLVDPKDMNFKSSKGGLEIRLDDPDGNAIDYLSVGGFEGQLKADCDFDYDTTMESTNSASILRLPDGTGDWADSGPGNSGGDPTKGESNEEDNGAGALDHYAISHSGTLVSCSAETVTITAHNPGDNAVDPGNVTVDLSTTTTEGSWTSVLSGSGNLNDGTPGDGAASYTFPGNGETSVDLELHYTSVTEAEDPETINIDVEDANGVTEKAGEDPDLEVSRSGFRITDGSGNPIDVRNQIAGKPSDTAPGNQSLGLQAVRTSDSDPSVCEPAFPDGSTVEVGLAGECKDPATCAGNELAVTNDGTTTSVDTSDDNGGNGAASYEPVNLLFGTNAEADIVLEYTDAGAIQFHARFDPIEDSGDAPRVQAITGASNDFVVRPFGLFVDFDPDGDGTFDNREANTSCADQTSCAADASGDVFTTSGAGFDAEINAVAWASGDDGNDDGVPDSNQAVADNALTPNFGQEATAETVDLTRILVAPSGGSSGTLSGGSSIGGFSGGRATASGVSWSEVGIIDLDAGLADGSYLGAGDATGTAPNVGRFIPADFEQTVADSGMFEAVHGAFTYTGQQFGYASGAEPHLKITARNTTGATTKNYTGNFAKLVAGDVDRTAPTQDDSQGGADGNGNLPVTAAINTGTLTDNGDGTLTYTFAAAVDNDPNDPSQPGAGVDAYTYDRNVDRDGNQRNDARIGPFSSDLTITVDAIEDSDGVSAAILNDVRPTGVEIRFGRLLVENAVGSEIASIDQPVRAEFWTGSTWEINGDDSETAVTLGTSANEIHMANNEDPDSPVDGDGTIDVDSGTTAIDETSPVSLTSGELQLTFAAPGEGNTGWVDTTALLEGQDHPYLRTDAETDTEDEDGVWDTDPSGRVTFGIFQGNDNWIHIRRVR